MQAEEALERYLLLRQTYGPAFRNLDYTDHTMNELISNGYVWRIWRNVILMPCQNRLQMLKRSSEHSARQATKLCRSQVFKVVASGIRRTIYLHTPWSHAGRVAVLLHSFWTAALDGGHCTWIRGEFRPRQTRQLPRAVDLKGRLLSCHSY